MPIRKIKSLFWFKISVAAVSPGKKIFWSRAEFSAFGKVAKLVAPVAASGEKCSSDDQIPKKQVAKRMKVQIFSKIFWEKAELERHKKSPKTPNPYQGTKCPKIPHPKNPTKKIAKIPQK